MMKRRTYGLIFYFILLFIPIYWMINTSFKTDTEILTQFTLFPKTFLSLIHI